MREVLDFISTTLFIILMLIQAVDWVKRAYEQLRSRPTSGRRGSGRNGADGVSDEDRGDT